MRRTHIIRKQCSMLCKVPEYDHSACTEPAPLGACQHPQFSRLTATESAYPATNRSSVLCTPYTVSCILGPSSIVLHQSLHRSITAVGTPFSRWHRHHEGRRRLGGEVICVVRGSESSGDLGIRGTSLCSAFEFWRPGTCSDRYLATLNLITGTCSSTFSLGQQIPHELE